MPVDIDNERPVELQLRERQARQQLERGDANAEIVDCHAVAQQPQVVQRDRQGQRIGHRTALGQLHRQRLPRHAAGGHQGIRRLQHARPAQGLRRRIDAQRNVDAGCAQPLLRCQAHKEEHRVGRIQCFEPWDKEVGLYQAVLGMAPAHQRLGAGPPAAAA